MTASPRSSDETMRRVSSSIHCGGWNTARWMTYSVSVQKASPNTTSATVRAAVSLRKAITSAVTITGMKQTCGTQARTWLSASIQSALNMRQDVSSLLAKRRFPSTQGTAYTECRTHGTPATASLVAQRDHRIAARRFPRRPDACGHRDDDHHRCDHRNGSADYHCTLVAAGRLRSPCVDREGRQTDDAQRLGILLRDRRIRGGGVDRAAIRRDGVYRRSAAGDHPPWHRRVQHADHAALQRLPVRRRRAERAVAVAARARTPARHDR